MLTELITVRVFFDNDKIQSYIRWEKVIFEEFRNPGEISEWSIIALILGGFFILFFFLLWHWYRFLSDCMSYGIHTILHKYHMHSLSFLALDVR